VFSKQIVIIPDLYGAHRTGSNAYRLFPFIQQFRAHSTLLHWVFDSPTILALWFLPIVRYIGFSKGTGYYTACGSLAFAPIYKDYPVVSFGDSLKRAGGQTRRLFTVIAGYRKRVKDAGTVSFFMDILLAIAHLSGINVIVILAGDYAGAATHASALIKKEAHSHI
jgi:hypothetical protein